MRSLSWIILLLLGLADGLHAQNNGTITARVKDAQLHTAIPFATVVLTDQNTKAVIKGMQTSTDGTFVFDHLPAGIFSLRVSFLGYDPVVNENIRIAAAGNSLNLGDLDMNTAKSKLLSEVTVTAKQATLQKSDGKKIFSVNQSLVSEGGTAADLLQNVPTLQLDADGNISLRGSTGIKVLVDGKPSLIAGGDLAQVLQSIPASAIESVEVINNPSAKYDAQGQSIINLVLKKNHKPGFNGSTALTGGTRKNYNSSTSVSYQGNKINVYGNYSIRDGDTYSKGFQYLTYLHPADPTVYSNENFYSTTSNRIQSGKAGIDYFITPKSTLSFSGSFNTRNTHKEEVLNIDNLNVDHSLLQSNNRLNTTNNNGSSYELDVDYSQQFKKPKEELTFNFSYAQGRFNNFQVYQSYAGKQASTTDPLPLKSDIHNSTTNYNIQADYVLPVGLAGQLSAGYRSQISPGRNDQYAFSGADPLYTFTDLFKNNNRVHAIYLGYQQQIKGFHYQVGVRAEDARLSGTLKSYDTSNVLQLTPVTVASKGLYPSVFLTQQLKNDQQLQLSYTRRVVRPTPREVNPSTDFSDPTNYETGNPHLLPQDIHSVSLGYNKNWSHISFSADAYYNQLNNVIKHIESEPVNGVILTTSQNLKRSVNTGLELISHFTLIKAWDFTVNANIFQRINDAAPQFGIAANNGLSWNANITNNITLAKNLSLQLRMDYRASDIVIQDRNRSAFGLDAGARYDFPGKRASLSFSSRDVFNSRKWAFVRGSDGVLMDFERRTQSSRASVTFTYHFGKGKNNPVKVKKVEEKPEKRIDEAS